MSAFDKYKTYIRSKFMLNSESPEAHEVEVRFTEFSQVRGVSLRTFNRLSQTFEGNISRIIENQIDYIADGIRRSVIGKEETYIRKTSIWGDASASGVPPKILDGYNLKFDISTEEKISPSDPQLLNFKSQVKVIRGKFRKSYSLAPGIQLDLTKVTMTDETRGEHLNYEVELELHTIDSIDIWVDAIVKVLTIIQDTEILYSKDEYLTVVEYINTRLVGHNNADDPKIILSSVVAQAKNLKFHHLTDMGLLGKSVAYRVTIKTDGIRKLMVYFNNSIYLIMYPSEVNKLVSYESDIFVGELDNTIFEGENVPIDRRRAPQKELSTNPTPLVSTKYYYLIFDLLSWARATDVRKEYHENRVKAAKILADKIKTLTGAPLLSIMTMETKEFRPFDTSDMFFMTIRDLEIDKLSQVYQDDGYIFMPNNVNYLDLIRHRGGNSPEILKWKPVDKLTIDLLIASKVNPDSSKVFTVYTNTYNSTLFGITQTKGGFGVISPISGNFGINMISYNYGGKSMDVLYLSFMNLSDAIIEGLMTRRVTVKFTPGTTKGIYNTQAITERSVNPDSWRKVIANIKANKTFIGVLEAGTVGTAGKSITVNLLAPSKPEIFDKPVLPLGLIDISKLPTSTIVEFSWKATAGGLSPDRVRSDKDVPNETKVAEDIWHMIEDPIELGTLTGDTLQLMRKYHNRIKRRLLNGNVKGLLPKFGNLLDIGSGIGGDVKKWGAYKKIICVEPSGAYLPELVSRISSEYGITPIIVVNISQLSNIKKEDKVLVLNIGGEQTQIISEAAKRFFESGKADVISSMLSLSFFWSEAYDGFISTIRETLAPGGVFMYLTIDGDLVTQYFDPLLRGPVLESPLRLLSGEVNLSYDGVIRKLGIEIPKSKTVKSQIEDLVFLDDLRLSLLDFTELAWYRADQESFLNSSEMILSAMYSYGGFRRGY